MKLSISKFSYKIILKFILLEKYFINSFVRYVIIIYFHILIIIYYIIYII